MSRAAKPLVLAADDDVELLRALRHFLENWGYRVECVTNKAELLRHVYDSPPSLLLLDLRFGEHDGLEILRELLERQPQLMVIMLTGFGSIDSAVTAIKTGAYDFLTKPVDVHRLQLTVAHALERQTLNQRIVQLSRLVDAGTTPREMLGNSAAMARLRAQLKSVSPTDATVMILGESGTGKELVARAIHEQSQRSSGPFVPLNMAALPRELVESTLFGHEKGAFTGADQPQQGCCEAADHGTLFLDEIGEMEVNLQSKLLRFLQEQTVQRVGATRARKVDVRIVAATNRNPEVLVQQGLLRADLYYRLNVVPLYIPPLRDRREDISLLANAFLQRAAARLGKPISGFDAAALELLIQYDWPGNVRQLQNLVERLAIFCQQPLIGPELIPPEVHGGVLPTTGTGVGPWMLASGPRPSVMAGETSGADSEAGGYGSWPSANPLNQDAEASDLNLTGGTPTIGTLATGVLATGGANTARLANLTAIEQMERRAIIEALEKAGGHVAEAARLLGLGQATVYRKVKRYLIDLSPYRP